MNNGTDLNHAYMKYPRLAVRSADVFCLMLVWMMMLPYNSYASVASKGGQKVPILLNAGPHLFIDDYLISKQTNLKRVINQPERLPKPIVTGEWDKCFQPYVTVVRDPDTKKFRIWYGIPAGGDSQTHLAYMESDDGINWVRPYRVLEDPDHIQFGTSIIDEGPKCSDPSKRYKFGWWSRGGLKVASSPDGFDWKLMGSGVVLEINHDITSIFRDSQTNKYIFIGSSYTTGDGWSGNRRIPMQSVSDDLIHWKDPWQIFVPDEKDEGETQFYSMAGLIRRGNMLVGLLKVLRDDLKAEGAPAGAYGIGYTVLAWSRDGKTWTRDREPFLPRNPEPGTWDHAMTWGDCQLIVGDETFIYYGGYLWGHKHERFIERQLGLARMPLDRYVSRDAGDEKGYLGTSLAKFKASEMTVNAKVDGGMQVRVLDDKGKPIPGFDWTDCKVITGDSVRHQVKWKKSLKSLSGSPVSFEFALRKAHLYGFSLL